MNKAILIIIALLVFSVSPVYAQEQANTKDYRIEVTFRNVDTWAAVSILLNHIIPVIHLAQPTDIKVESRPHTSDIDPGEGWNVLVNTQDKK